MGKSKKRVPIDELLDYWTDLSKRSTLTLKDFALFFERAKATRSHFSESYPYMRDKFFDRIDFLPFYQGRLLKAATEKKRLSNNDYAQIKNAAKNFIPRIKRWFGADIIAAVKKKTPPQDAEALLATSTKLTYRWAAGIIASNHIANLLIQLSRFRSGEKYRDDIMTL